MSPIKVQPTVHNLVTLQPFNMDGFSGRGRGLALFIAEELRPESDKERPGVSGAAAEEGRGGGAASAGNGPGALCVKKPLATLTEVLINLSIYLIRISQRQ